MSTASVTQTGGAATVAVTVSRGLQGAIGATGATGATGETGAAGPNSVTSATTSDGTCDLVIDTLQASGSTAITTDANSSTPFNVKIADGSSFPRRVIQFTNLGNSEFAYLNVAVFGDNTVWTLGGNGGTLAVTDDPRFTDARTPLAHTHSVSDIVSVSSNSLIGRHAGGSGAAQEVTVGNGLEFSGSGIRREALTGDITASAGSNSTTLAGTIAGNKTFTGDLSFTSTTRPTSAGTGTPEATSLITRADGDARYGGPFYDLDGSASHSESAATTPVKTVVLPVGTYLIEYAKLHAVHTDTTSRTVTITVNFTGGTATIQDRGIQSHVQSGNILGLTYASQGASLTQSVAITNASPSFGAGAHYFTGRIVVTAETTLRIFGFCSVTPTNPISYETSGILRKIA